METRGGKRPGAGRKEINPADKRVQFCVSVRPDVRWKAAVIREHGIRLGQIIDKVIDDIYEELESQEK